MLLPSKPPQAPVHTPRWEYTSNAPSPSAAHIEKPTKITSEYINKVHEIENRIFEHITSLSTNEKHSFPPKDQLWRVVFMEREYLSKGKWGYEAEEPGYLLGIYQGYLLMIQNLNAPLTPQLYRKLHDTCSLGVASQEAPEGIPLGFRKRTDDGEGIPLVPGVTSSAAGIAELKERYRTYSYKDPETSDEHYPLQEAMLPPAKTLQGLRPVIKLRPAAPETCEANVQFCISLYEKAPKTSEIQKLRAIARLCQDLDQFHVFVDGNIRTTGILLLNKLLIEQGLSPASMEDVNQLDCLSESEIIELIKVGQKNFQNECSSP